MQFVYQKALIPAFWLENHLCEIQHYNTNSKGTQTSVLNVRFKDFWYIKLNLT